MTFDEIRQEVKDCGLDHLPDTRVNRLVNLAYHRTYNKELWPWRLAETSGTAPLTITGTIRQVFNSSGYALSPNTQEGLENNGYPLTTAGTATDFYLDENRAVNTYPVDSGTLTVRYYRKVSDMSAGTDTPSIPSDYHYLIVLDAVRRGKAENGELDAAQQYAYDYLELLADLKRDAFNEVAAGGYQLSDLIEGT